MHLYNKTIKIDGKKVGKQRLKNFLFKLVEDKKLRFRYSQTNVGYSDELYFYSLDPSIDKYKCIFNLSTSKNWSTFVSDYYSPDLIGEIPNLEID
jgi:hypothetical protein